MVVILNYFLSVAAMAAVSYGCSMPEGGYVEPTEAEMVHYSDHVIVGKVQTKIDLDPVFGDMYGNSVYGARVEVWCIYKGGPLKTNITIHGAGFVPGLCTEKPLVPGRELILFLESQREPEMTYFQQFTAMDYRTSIEKLQKVCDVAVTYPEDAGSSAERKTCPGPDTLKPCHRFNARKGKTFTERPVVARANGFLDPPAAETTTETTSKTVGSEQGPKAGYSRNLAPGKAASTVAFTLCALIIFMLH